MNTETITTYRLFTLHISVDLKKEEGRHLCICLLCSREKNISEMQQAFCLASLVQVWTSERPRKQPLPVCQLSALHISSDGEAGKEDKQTSVFSFPRGLTLSFQKRIPVLATRKILPATCGQTTKHLCVLRFRPQARMPPASQTTKHPTCCISVSRVGECTFPDQAEAQVRQAKLASEHMKKGPWDRTTL